MSDGFAVSQDPRVSRARRILGPQDLGIATVGVDVGRQDHVRVVGRAPDHHGAGAIAEQHGYVAAGSRDVEPDRALFARSCGGEPRLRGAHSGLWIRTPPRTTTR